MSVLLIFSFILGIITLFILCSADTRQYYEREEYEKIVFPKAFNIKSSLYLEGIENIPFYVTPNSKKP